MARLANAAGGQTAACSQPAAARYGCGRAPTAPACAWARGAGGQNHQSPSTMADGHHAAALAACDLAVFDLLLVEGIEKLTRAPALVFSLLGERLPVAAKAAELQLFDQ